MLNEHTLSTPRGMTKMLVNVGGKLSDNVFCGKRIVIIGRLKSKRDYIAKIELAGGKYLENMSSRIDIAIIPDNIEAQPVCNSQFYLDAIDKATGGNLLLIGEEDARTMLFG